MLKMITSGEWMLHLWVIGIAATIIVTGVLTGFFRAHKVQPKGFKWKQFGFEFVVAIVGGIITGWLLGGTTRYLNGNGFILFDQGAATWWRVALEYGLYFVLFDTWFYWWHRAMHKEPMYFLVHKLHHKSTSTNPLTTLSVNPLESFINGGFVPLFLTTATALNLPVSNVTAALILPTNIIMGIYVHSGFEFFPRWWNKTWATKWFITATFHDQHHKYFNWNFGGYTTVWDRICGTNRAKFEADYDKICERRADWWARPFRKNADAQ
jgi:sterol desaturase/sphingolipid hydroxylase (fatty acid hydroxylase superfamily)